MLQSVCVVSQVREANLFVLIHKLVKNADCMIIV